MVESEEHHSFFPTYNTTAQNFPNSTSNEQSSNSFINKSTLSTNTKEIIEYSKPLLNKMIFKRLLLSIKSISSLLT